MEILLAILFIGVVFYVAKGLVRPRDYPSQNEEEVPLRWRKPARKPIQTHRYPPYTPPSKTPTRPQANMPEIVGPAYVVDGDSLVICKTQIRIYGVDAPELNHPYGQKAKWAMVALCKGQQVRAKIVEQDHHGRAVAMCYLPDGRDLSEEMVKLGLALDWPKYSEGDYRMHEPQGVRKKLWLADARQKGHMHVWKRFEAQKKARAEAQAK